MSATFWPFFGSIHQQVGPIPKHLSLWSHFRENWNPIGDAVLVKVVREAGPVKLKSYLLIGSVNSFNNFCTDIRHQQSPFLGFQDQKYTEKKNNYLPYVQILQTVKDLF